jgi:hypothetical protein
MILLYQRNTNENKINGVGERNPVGGILISENLFTKKGLL